MKSLWLKIARGEKLTDLEVEEFANIGDKLESASSVVSAWSNLNLNPVLKNPQISNPIWKTSPLRTLYVERHTDVAIANGVDTAVTFETTFGDNQFFSLLESDLSKVMVKVTNMPFNVNGIFAFAANATGYRNAKLAAYDKDDVLIGSATIASFPAWSAADNVIPFSYPVTAAQQYAVSYFKMTVGQTSGGSLNLKYFDMGVSLS